MPLAERVTVKVVGDVPIFEKNIASTIPFVVEQSGPLGLGVETANVFGLLVI